MKICTHRSIVLLGNEETGLRGAQCRRCGEEMTFRRFAGDFVIWLSSRLRDALYDSQHGGR